MKRILLIMVCCVASIGMMAQTTKVISGAVIDKNGNPLPNALVEATGGAESVTTDADGTFTIEVPYWLKSLTAKYNGFCDKKKKVTDIRKNQNLIFEMKPESDKGCWFVNAAYSMRFFYDDGEDMNGNYGLMGIMGGYLGKWGCYGKLSLPLDDQYTQFIPSVSLGITKRIVTPVHFYFGVGYSRVFGYTDFDGKNYYDGALIETGFLFKIKHFDCSVGYGISLAECYVNNEIQFSLGYCF